MRVEFQATEGGFLADEDAIGFTLGGGDEAGNKHYLNLQRSPESSDPEDDWGIYLEFDDQANSGYGCLAMCRLCRQRLSIEFSKPLGRWLPRLVGIEVGLLGISDGTYEELRRELPRAFRDFEAQLVIT